MEQFIGQIMLFGGNFAPRDWALCDGQLLSIAQNQALFSILGTTYGGDGRTTFGLPDLRGRVPVHAGSGPGLTPVNRGEKSGRETVTLTVNELPSHHHSGSTLTGTSTIPSNDDDGDSSEPNGRNLGNAEGGEKLYNSEAASGALLEAGSVTIGGNTANTGNGQSFNIRNPYQGVYYIIALQGIYPSRN